uniref:ATP receptor n=1 Tax=Sarcophilus harrisii TaxID=9305 RepID=A0A7N4PPJ2_SARHA
GLPPSKLGSCSPQRGLWELRSLQSFQEGEQPSRALQPLPPRGWGANLPCSLLANFFSLQEGEPRLGCVYHKSRDPLCPIFELGSIVRSSGQNFSTLAVKGGVVGITIDWNCDLDWAVRHCRPVYEFHGLYNEENNLSPGFNFRFARYYTENGTQRRHLFKVFGIRFDILVDGQAGKFDIIPTMTTIGSGIGIFGVVSGEAAAEPEGAEPGPTLPSGPGSGEGAAGARSGGRALGGGSGPPGEPRPRPRPAERRDEGRGSRGLQGTPC